MKVAIVHDYFCQMGGAERVVEVLHGLFPDAPIYTTLVCRDQLWPGLRDAEFRTSPMQWLPWPRRTYRFWFPLYPWAIDQMDLSGFDLVISSSAAFSKGVNVRPGARHICYCHTPMRYVWDYDAYVARERFGPLTRRALPPMIERMREWDLRTGDHPSLYIANSTAVAERIRRCYGRQAEIIHPPVGIDRYSPSDEDADYYLVVSRLVAYKRIDLAVAAFTAMNRPLLVIGDGPARRALQRMAGPTITFVGRLPDEDVAYHYARCRGLVFPGIEDFGIVPIEANAAGRPVVAYRAGGALDTVVDGRTGVFFEAQTVADLEAAVRRCDAIRWDKAVLGRHAARFSQAEFVRKFMAVLDDSPADGYGNAARRRAEPQAPAQRAISMTSG
jgi:glycosyltransferase involved in cell wall biosynthesis